MSEKFEWTLQKEDTQIADKHIKSISHQRDTN